MARMKSEYLDISLVPIQIERERLPSFCAELKVMFFHSEGYFAHESGRVWFGIDDWSEFIKNLDLRTDVSKVSDFSIDMSIEVARCGLKDEVSMEFRNRIYDVGEGGLKINFREGSGLWEGFLSFAKSVEAEYLSIFQCSNR